MKILQHIRRAVACAALFGSSLFAQQPTLMNRAIITSNAIVNGGVNVPATEFEVDSTLTTSPRGIMSAQYSATNDGARLHLRKARGTRAAPTIISTGDNLGRIVGTGYDGSGFLEMASIYFAAEGTVALTRVPTNIQFWTGTNAAPSVLTLAATINSAQQFVNNVGSAGAPSYSFAGATGLGIYAPSNTTIGFSQGGGNMLTIGANGLLTGTGSNTLQLNGSGGITMNAGGTNQSITFAPSGTGKVVVSSADPTVTSTGNLTLQATGGQTVLDSSSANFYFKSGTLAQFQTDGNMVFRPGSVTRMTLVNATGNLLLGGLTTDGANGYLQFPAATTIAGAWSLGTDLSLYRTAAGTLRLDNVGGTAAVLKLAEGSTDKGYLGTSSGVVQLYTSGATNLTIGTNNTTALTISSSQNITTTGNITIAAAGTFQMSGRTQIKSGSDGVLLIQDNAGATFDRLQFGGTAASFPAWKRSSTVLQSRLADDSGWASIAASSYNFQDLGNIFASSDGVLKLTNNAGTDFTRLQFGGTSASFPAIKRNAAQLDLRLADDSAYANVSAGTVQSTGFARVTGDATNATATMSNLTNLSVTVAAGVHYVGTIQIFGVDSTGADGLAFDLGGGACTFTDLEFGFAAQPTGSTLGTVTSTTSTTAITLTVVSTSDAVYTISFGFTVNAAGTFIPRFAQNSHSTGTATVRKNSSILSFVSTN